MFVEGKVTRTCLGFRPEPVHVSKEMAAHLPCLQEWGILEECRGMITPCGLFGVGKKDGSTRVIVDARPANQCIEPLGGMKLFSLEELTLGMEGLRQAGPVFKVNCDFRHYFYQLPLIKNLRPFFVLASGKGCLSRRLTVVPMGFHSSPKAAQSCSWVIIGFKELGEDDLGLNEEDLRNEMPTLVFLYDDSGCRVGLVALILDNILVATSTNGLAERWANRLRRNAKKFGVVFKGDVGNIYDDSTIFCGIEFSNKGWRPETLPTGTLTGGVRYPARKVASVIGANMWVCRVYGSPLCEHHGLLGLARRVGREAFEAWETEIAITAEEALDVQDTVDRWAHHPFKVLQAWVLSGDYVRMATDATPTHWAVVEMRDRLEECTVWTGPTTHARIEECEMEAVLQAVKTREREGQERKPLLIATDNEIVRFTINKGHSSSEALNKMICIIVRYEVIMLRVPTEENVADCPSRGVTTLDPGRHVATWARLEVFAASKK